jgi:hypothetical protein
MADDEVLIDGKGGRKVTGEEVVDGSNTYRAQHVVVLGGKSNSNKLVYSDRFSADEVNITAAGSEIEIDNSEGLLGISLTVNEITVYVPAGEERRFNFGSFTGYTTTLDSGWDTSSPDKKYEVRIYE